MRVYILSVQLRIKSINLEDESAKRFK